MIINAQTRIGTILKARPDALEAIISLSPKFEKLRNPLLRKVIASRTSIEAATKIGNCDVSDFFRKLKPLGFETADNTIPVKTEEKKVPEFMLNLLPEFITVLDVRPVLSAGSDPRNLIIKATKEMKPGRVLKLINSFYPEPLVLLLKKQGFEAYADTLGDNLVETYFHKTGMTNTLKTVAVEGEQNGWDDILEKYKHNLQELDVRQMKMPLPMITILDALDKLAAGRALFIYHKRIPVYLLPELADREFNYRVKEISEENVNLIIFKN